jgi:hypothetical protein
MPPIRKRSDERIRRNIEPPTEKVTAFGAVIQPSLDFEDPHPTVVRMWKALGDSAFTKYYEPTDWEMARVMLHFLDGQLKYHKPNANMVSVIQSMMSDLLFSEGSRRRVRLEIEREALKQGQVFDIASLLDERARGA